MELIKEIYDSNKKNNIVYELRKAARTVLFNNVNEIALLFAAEDNYHKLPSGGIEVGEKISPLKLSHFANCLFDRFFKNIHSPVNQLFINNQRRNKSNTVLTAR